jgi:hypothetical protein
MQRDPELRDAERRWLSGDSALPVVTLLVSRGADIEAAAVARLALTRPDCPDAVELKAIVARLAALPEGWEKSLAEFAEAPSMERWRQLMLFVPAEYAYRRLRETVRRLMSLGTDADVLFTCASEHGLIPELIELVEDGRVSADTLVERAASSRGAKATYLGLAAEAAFLAGDLFRTMRLLRDACACENDWLPALPHVIFIRERASHEQLDLLDRAGIPMG